MLYKVFPGTKAENMWVKVPESGLGHNFWWFVSLFRAIGVITVIIFPYRLWKPTKKDIFDKRKGSLHGLLQSYLVMCDLKTSPTCLNRHHLTRREGTLPNKKVSPMSESYIMWYFWGNYSKNPGNYGLRRECFLGKCKKCVWVTGRFQLSQFQLLRSQCIVPLNLVLGVQVQKHLTRLNSFRLRSKFNLKQQWDVCLPHNTWTFSNKNEN